MRTDVLQFLHPIDLSTLKVHELIRLPHSAISRCLLATEVDRHLLHDIDSNTVSVSMINTRILYIP